MTDSDWLARRFEENRSHLRGVAFRILGSLTEAEDAVQDAWLRLSRSDADEVANLSGWLTTVVARVSLNMLQSRQSRREEPNGSTLADDIAAPAHTGHPEDEAVLADSVGSALLVVLDSLEPAERLAFVLHDMFAIPFDEIAPIVGRSAVATRQLASRARRRVQASDPTAGTDRARQRQIVAAFLDAARNGQFDARLALLDPQVELRADAAAVRMGARARVFGSADVAETFSGRARAAQAALIDGSAGAVWSVNGQPRVVFGFSIVAGKIAAIEMISDADTLNQLAIERLGS
jgi:RNA polymerase sigma factor (sigma-70 family)